MQTINLVTNWCKRHEKLVFSVNCIINLVGMWANDAFLLESERYECKSNENNTTKNQLRNISSFRIIYDIFNQMSCAYGWLELLFHAVAFSRLLIRLFRKQNDCQGIHFRIGAYFLYFESSLSLFSPSPTLSYPLRHTHCRPFFSFARGGHSFELFWTRLQRKLALSRYIPVLLVYSRAHAAQGKGAKCNKQSSYLNLCYWNRMNE